MLYNQANLLRCAIMLISPSTVHVDPSGKNVVRGITFTTFRHDSLVIAMPRVPDFPVYSYQLGMGKSKGCPGSGPLDTVCTPKEHETSEGGSR